MASMTALITYVKQSIELVLLDIPEELVVGSHEVSHRAVCPANLLPGLVHPLGQIHWGGKDLKLLSLEDPLDLLQLPIPHHSVEAKLYFKILKIGITDISWTGGSHHQGSVGRENVPNSAVSEGLSTFCIQNLLRLTDSIHIHRHYSQDFLTISIHHTVWVNDQTEDSYS